MKKEAIGLSMAIDFLEILNSSCDPVYYKKEETMVYNLYHKLGDKLAGRIKIDYYIGGGKIKSGTVLSMIKDRLKDYRI